MMTPDDRLVEACTLSCKDKALRLEDLNREIFQYVDYREEDANSVRLIFANSQPSEATLQQFIALEEQCCNFLSMTLTQENNNNIVTINCPEQYRSQLREWLKPLSHTIESTRPKKTFFKSLESTKKMSFYVMTLSAVLCCVSPFLVAGLGLAGLGFGLALPALTQMLENIFIVIAVVAMVVAGCLWMLPKLLCRESGKC